MEISASRRLFAIYHLKKNVEEVEEVAVKKKQLFACGNCKMAVHDFGTTPC